MGVVTRAKKRRLEEEEEQLEDHISLLPDAVLGDILSLLPTKDGARTQVLSSRWRQLWWSAPLHIDLSADQPILRGAISRILSSHQGPGRRFSVRIDYGGTKDRAAATLDGWLRSRALDNLQELEFHLGLSRFESQPPLPPSPVRRFSSTLRVASFGACRFTDDDGDAAAAGALHLPLLKQLSLLSVVISASSLHALLAGCPVLESLLLLENEGCPRVQIVSPSLRSIGVGCGSLFLGLQELVIEDAPCLERLLVFGGKEMDKEMDISIISAPTLKHFGNLSSKFPRLRCGATAFQGSSIVSLTLMLPSVKVLAIYNVKLRLDAVIDLIKCFPSLEKLYIKTGHVQKKNVWYTKYRNLIRTLDIRLKKIVLANYRGRNKSHISFAKFFVSNARVLESMTLELEVGNIGSAWIKRQHRLLQIEKRASRVARFDFVSSTISIGSLSHLCYEQVHDLSTADPFERFHY